MDEETKGASRRCEEWDELYESGRTPWETNRAASQLVTYVKSSPVRGLRCIELCCGTGASSVFLAQQGASIVVGVDISSKAIEAAKARASRAGVSDKCVFVCEDLLGVRSGQDLCEECPGQFDFAFDCQGFQLLWAEDADRAAAAAAGLLAKGGTLVTVAGNANEYRAYDGGGTSLTVAELVGSLSPPAFELESLVETRFDAGERGQGDDNSSFPPLAWRGVFVRTHGDQPQSSSSSSRKVVVPLAEQQQQQQQQQRPLSSSKRSKQRRDEQPPVIARKLKSFAAEDMSSSGAAASGAIEETSSSNAGSSSRHMDDAVDAALSVDGSVAPSDCGSASTSAFAGADGFENIAASRAAAARAERARAEGDVPWVRWWDRRANAYDALCDAQPVLKRLAQRVANAALHWAVDYDSLAARRDNDDDDEAAAAGSPQPPTSAAAAAGSSSSTTPAASFSSNQEDDSSSSLSCVDLASGSGLCAWELAECLAAKRVVVRADLIEPSHAMAAIARARAASLCRTSGVNATVWQIPAERCHDRLPPRLLASVDVVTCSSAVDCLNYHDVFEVAAALLRPGGALAFDLSAEAYEGTVDDDTTSCWLSSVRSALSARGLLDMMAAAAKSSAASSSPTPRRQRGEGDEECEEDDDLDAVVARVRSRPRPRPPVSASSIAAAASAAGLRLAECRVSTDDVAGDFFVAYRAMSTSWLAEPFAGMSKHDAKHLRSVVLLDAASRAARNSAKMRSALFVVVKPSARVDAALTKLLYGSQNNSDDDENRRHSERQQIDDSDRDPPASRPIAQSINNDHFAAAGPAKV